MNSDENFAAIREKIKSLPCSPQVVDDVREILGYLTSLEFSRTNTLFRELFQKICDKFTNIFSENLDMFETSEDDFVKVIIKLNYGTVLQVTEVILEMLDLVSRNAPVELLHIEPIVVYVPSLVQMYSFHLNNCPELHMETFIHEITEITEAIKHLYGIYLHLLEFSITISSENEILSAVLMALCQMPKDFSKIDPKCILSCWKCFNVLTNRYKAYIGHFDFSVVVKLINEFVCDLLENMNTISEKQSKVINFIIKILFINIQRNFYDKLSEFVKDLLIFYIKMYKFINSEVLNEIFKQIEGYLGDLLAEKPHVFKQAIENLKIEDMDDCPIGSLRFLNRILQLINGVSFNWPIIALINYIFDVLPLCQKELLMPPNQNGWVYQNLIVNMSAAILIHNVNVEGTTLLIKYILKEEVFGALLALEVYLLVLRNIPEDDCTRLVINLFNATERLEGVYFTHKPEYIYLKCLLQRIFKFLSHKSKLDLLKVFHPDEHIQVWRFLGFACIQNQEIFEPVINNTVNYIKELDNYKRRTTPFAGNQMSSEPIALNIGEGIGLLSTITDRNIVKNKITTITSFMDTFLSLDFTTDILNNNLFQYFIMKIRFFDSKIISKFQILCQNPAYYTSIYRIISSYATSNHQDALTEIAMIFPYVFENTSILFKQLYFEMLRDLKDNKKTSFKVLLERLDAKLANQMFKYFERFDHMNPRSSLSPIHIEMEKFQHNCLKWNQVVMTPKQMKFDELESQKTQQSKFNEINVDRGVKRTLELPKVTVKKKSKTNCIKKFEEEKLNSSVGVENDITAVSDVIQNLKSETKCLMKTLKTDKLTAKNANDLKNIIAQLSSLMYL
ncbi:unnamed protein product [Ceutorhynchus assimilis]|uniref:Uncharacterized protein n=1 Tax=Ceutorhynchus assimilis TaxID=467358 RepID=A0A9N9MJD0_9CUCU|nr:unnamed protein product [Ceutorhynchus assimilis]